MKSQKHLSWDVFLTKIKVLMQVGFIEQTKLEFVEMMRSKKIPFYRKFQKSEGIEKCYYYFTETGILVLVYPTYTDYLQGAKDNDSGWVLIIHPNNPTTPFFSFPRRRSDNFLANVISDALVFKEIADKWPVCKCCQTPLKLIKVKGLMHMRAFICPSSKEIPHRKRPYFWVIEMELDPKTSELFIAPFKRYYSYLKREAVAGRIHVPQRVKRYFANLGLKAPTVESYIGESPVSYPDLETVQYDTYHDGDHLE